MKGVAVPYIIALLLGIIVLAIAVYLIYKSINNGSFDCDQCKARFTSWCSTCYLANSGTTDWTNPGTSLGTELAECLNKCQIFTGLLSTQTCGGMQDKCAVVGIP